MEADPDQRYKAFAAETTMERLQIIRRQLLTSGLDLVGDADGISVVDKTKRGEEMNDLGFFE
jgi:hypothetical protein